MHRVIRLPDRELYRRAREVIQRHFSFVGVAERFSASLVALSHSPWSRPCLFVDAHAGLGQYWRFPIFIRGSFAIFIAARRGPLATYLGDTGIRPDFRCGDDIFESQWH